MLMLVLTASSLPRMIVCGELKSGEKVIVPPLVDAAIASRSEQSASQTPSFVSAVLVTTRLVGATYV